MSRLADYLTGAGSTPDPRADGARKALARALQSEPQGPPPVLVKNLVNHAVGHQENRLVSSIVRRLSE
jgi:hypothetical protein